jgi:hypothetical protein
MPDGRSVTSARVITLGSLNILGKTGHVTIVKACFLSGLKAGMLDATVSGAGDFSESTRFGIDLERLISSASNNCIFGKST